MDCRRPLLQNSELSPHDQINHSLVHLTRQTVIHHPTLRLLSVHSSMKPYENRLRRKWNRWMVLFAIWKSE
ncbi:hypothetical protein AVEN_206308-1, partial [Araneus ventricosus]